MERTFKTRSLAKTEEKERKKKRTGRKKKRKRGVRARQQRRGSIKVGKLARRPTWGRRTQCYHRSLSVAKVLSTAYIRTRADFACDCSSTTAAAVRTIISERAPCSARCTNSKRRFSRECVALCVPDSQSRDTEAVHAHTYMPMRRSCEGKLRCTRCRFVPGIKPRKPFASTQANASGCAHWDLTK